MFVDDGEVMWRKKGRKQTRGRGRQTRQREFDVDVDGVGDGPLRIVLSKSVGNSAVVYVHCFWSLLLVSGRDRRRSRKVIRSISHSMNFVSSMPVDTLTT